MKRVYMSPEMIVLNISNEVLLSGSPNSNDKIDIVESDETTSGGDALGRGIFDFSFEGNEW